MEKFSSSTADFFLLVFYPKPLYRSDKGIFETLNPDIAYGTTAPLAPSGDMM